MFLELADIDILGKHLATIADDYDICVIDTHPDASILTENALAISDMVLIPISLDGFSRDNLNFVIKEIIKLETRCGEINFKVFVNKLKNLRSRELFIAIWSKTMIIQYSKQAYLIIQESRAHFLSISHCLCIEVKAL